jgi:hypothetical protein
MPAALKFVYGTLVASEIIQFSEFHERSGLDPELKGRYEQCLGYGKTR